MDIWKGLQEALFNPIAKDWKNAYRMGRVARERYPASDAITNFIPYLGSVLNIDDAANNVMDSQYSDVPGDLAGLALNVGTTLSGVRGLKSMVSSLPRSRRGRAAALGFGAPTSLYLNHYMEQQKQANERFGSKSLRDIFMSKYNEDTF